ncbi:hypothetical protein FQA39_LY03788 [Lamprigera yunnana]|nr:hypothetical protein FQA39_LY03788 [Lamprigera yunnana]
MNLEEVITPNSSFRVALPQIVAVMVKNLLLVAFGMTLGYPTILIPGLSGNDANEEFRLNQEQVSWIGSINLMCVPLGCILSGVITQPVGRRRSMQIITIPLALSWVIFKFANQVWHIYLALSITGLCGGLVEAPVLSYVAEITTPNLRGMLSAASTLCVTLGILIQFLLGTLLPWRSVAMVSLGPPLLSFCLLCFMPESPHWLIMYGKLNQARKSLAWLRGWVGLEKIEEEFEAMCLSHNVSSKENIYKTELETISFKETLSKKSENLNQQSSERVESILIIKLNQLRLFTRKSFLWPFGMVGFIYFLMNFTGVWTLQTYAVNIFATLNVPIDKYYATILLGLAEFFGCFITIGMIRFLGKRVTGFMSVCAVGICDIVIGTYAYINNVKYLQFQDASITLTPVIDGNNWIPLTFLLLLAFTGHCGLKSLPWILIGEIYSHETRATGCGCSSALSYVFGFLANKIFLDMINLLTLCGMYWFYAIISFGGCIVMYFILPETEGKSLQEITNHFAGISKLDNNVRKKSTKKVIIPLV